MTPAQILQKFEEHTLYSQYNGDNTVILFPEITDDFDLEDEEENSYVGGEYQAIVSGSSYIESGIKEIFLGDIDSEYQDFPQNFMGSQSVWDFYSAEDEDSIIKEIKKYIQEDRIELARKKVEEAVNIYPESARIKKLYHVLQPPKILSKKLPARKSHHKERDWLKENSYKYRGYWVALYDRKLIAHDIHLKNVLKKARKNYHFKDILVHFVPK